MEKQKEFSKEVLENIGYYVYALIDKTTGKIFYVGKGTGNRVFDHVKEAEESSADLSEKVKTIKKNNGDIDYLILRHWQKPINKKEEKAQEELAFEVESMMIDFLEFKPYLSKGIADLTNIQSGHHQSFNGIKTISEIEEEYGHAQKANIKSYLEKGLNVIAIKINGTFKRFATDEDIYQGVRFCWRVSLARANKQDYVLAVYNDIIRGVYPCKGCWKRVEEGQERIPGKDENRCYFDQPTTLSDKAKAEYEAIKKDLVGKRLDGLNKQNPVNYIHE